MRLQLTITLVAAVAAGLGLDLVTGAPAWADDRVDATTTWYQESRRGGLGGLTVIHPQIDLGTDLGDHVTLDVGYAADAVSGATASVYAVDAVSSATTFSDLRHVGSLGLGFQGNRSRLGFTGSVGVERDYLSITVGGGGDIDLPGKNTNLAASYTHNFDQVCDRDNPMVTPLERRALTGADPCKKDVIFGADSFADEVTRLERVTTWRDLSIDTAQGTMTQNLSPTSVLQLSLYGQVLQGFQENPYRRVRVGASEPQENVPDTRARVALTARYNRYLPGARGAVHFDARGYSDTWGVNAGTLELAYSQYAGSSLLLRLRARVHQQTAATFFKDAFFYQTESSAGAYFTGDRELAPVRNVMVGGKLSLLTASEDGGKVWAIFDKVQLNLKGDVLFLTELPADDTEANVAGTGDQFLSSGQVLDAFVLQLGLLLDY